MNNKKKQRGTYEDDLEDQYFDDDEDIANKDQNDGEDDVDPLDAYMQNLESNVAAVTTQPSGQKHEILKSDDPLDSFMDSMKDKLIKDYNKKHNIKKKEGDPENEDGEDEEDPNYEFLDSEGELDLDAVRKMKKQKIEPLPTIDHSKVQYEAFNKDFYDEHEELKALPNERVNQLRQEMEIKVHGSDVPKPLISFGHLPFDQKMISLIQKKNFEKPTAIQCQALPCVLSGRDVIGIAKTGSGKTLAYVWPMIIHALDQREVAKNEGPIGLILCPTRELAQQVYVETKRFAKAYNLKVAALLGGENKHEQWKELKAGVDVIVATPGRLMEMIKKKATNLQRCTYIVLDEADRMFSMGFEYQVRSIIGQTRPERQTLLFSATFRDKIQKLCFDILNDAIRINIGRENQANEDVKQEVVVLYKQEDKLAWLLGNLSFFYQLGKILIFANQIGSCEELAKQISEGLSYNTLVLHGDKLQHERTVIINTFKTSPEHNILVATDVASRGLDIPDIRTVVNYECPKDGDTYIHRIGRTGRAGNKEGTAFTLIFKHEVKFAITLTKILEISGQTVPKELESIAWDDEEYVRNQKMKKMGLKKGNAASKLLEKALAGGRRGTAGLGYTENKQGSNKQSGSEEQGRRLTFQKSSLLESGGNSYTSNISFVQPQQQTAPVQYGQYAQYSAPATTANYYQQAAQPAQTNIYQQQQQQASNMYQSRPQQQFVAASGPKPNTNTVMSAREQVMAEYSNRLKGNMQNQFKSSFVPSGSLEASHSVPTITFKNKPKTSFEPSREQMEPKASNITIQLPKKKSRFSDGPVESNLVVPSNLNVPSNLSAPYAASKFTYQREDDREERVPTKRVRSNWDKPPEEDS